MGAGVHLYQMTYWKGARYWYVNDVKNLTGRSAKWYTPMRILNLSIEDYINLLVNKFNAQGLSYYASTDYLSFYFLKESEAKAFCSHVNKKAKISNYYCA